MTGDILSLARNRMTLRHQPYRMSAIHFCQWDFFRLNMIRMRGKDIPQSFHLIEHPIEGV